MNAGEFVEGVQKNVEAMRPGLQTREYRAARFVAPAFAAMLYEHYRETGEVLDVENMTHRLTTIEGTPGIRFDFPCGAFIEVAFDPETAAQIPR